MVRALVVPVLWFVLVSGCTAKSADRNTREHVISNFQLVMKSWDKDGDGRLSRSEVETMVNAAFRRMPRDSSTGELRTDLDKQRQEMLGFYASQDTNHDGYLTLNELLKGPLATFDCMDQDHDGKVTEDEVFKGGPDKCGSVNLDDYAPKAPNGSRN